MGSLFEIAKDAASADDGGDNAFLDGLSTGEGIYSAVDSATDVVTTGLGGTGFGPMSALGLGLSAVGLNRSVRSIAKNGANGDNVTDALFNYAGVGAGVSSLAGAALATGSAPLLTAFATGGMMGKASNSFAKKHGLAGKGDDGENRNYSEMAADMGVRAKAFGGDGVLGDVLGVGATLGGSLVGTAATIGTLPFMAVEAIGDAFTGPSTLAPLDQRPTVHDMVKSFGRPSELQLVQRMQGMGATVQQQASRGGRK